MVQVHLHFLWYKLIDQGLCYLLLVLKSKRSCEMIASYGAGVEGSLLCRTGKL